MIKMSELGELLRKGREQKGLSMGRAAKEAGMRVQPWHFTEHGKSCIGVDRYPRIAEVLDVSVGELLVARLHDNGWTDEMILAAANVVTKGVVHLCPNDDSAN